MRITIEIQESEITGKTLVQTAQANETAKPADAVDGGSPAAGLLEEIQGAGGLGKTAGRETPQAAGDGGGAPVE